MLKYFGDLEVNISIPFMMIFKEFYSLA